MSELMRVLPMVFDPRGRCDRKGLLILMLITLFLQACFGAVVFGLGVSFTGPFAVSVKLVFVWVALSATIQRLHDVGRSGWWLLGAIVGLLVWMVIWGGVVPLTVALTYGAQAIQLYSPLFFTFIGISYVPLIAGALWLHFKKGQGVSNRFGPVPDHSGFARTYVSARRVASTTVSSAG